MPAGCFGAYAEGTMGVKRFVSQEMFLAHRLPLCSMLLCSGACGWPVVRSVGLLSMIHIWEVSRGMQCYVGLLVQASQGSFLHMGR